jgi:predicted RNase H-like HicB family nuclease
MMVERHGSNVSWQNMASLLEVAGFGISRSIPQGGESCLLGQKPTPESVVCRGGGLIHYQPSGADGPPPQAFGGCFGIVVGGPPLTGSVRPQAIKALYTPKSILYAIIGVAYAVSVSTEEAAMVKHVKIIVEKHPDGYVAYPLGLKGVIVGEGDTYEEALADVQSAITFHIETFGSEVVEDASSVLEVFVAEAGIPL